MEIDFKFNEKIEKKQQIYRNIHILSIISFLVADLYGIFLLATEPRQINSLLDVVITLKPIIPYVLVYIGILFTRLAYKWYLVNAIMNSVVDSLKEKEYTFSSQEEYNEIYNSFYSQIDTVLFGKINGWISKL